MAWQYQREESTQFERVPEGDHRIRVKSTEFKKSSSGNDMIAIQFDVSGYNSTLYHNIVFLESNPQVTNRMLTQFYDSFKDIPEGDNHISNWVGKTGACHVKHEEYNGKIQSRVHYFIPANKQGGLPPWKDSGTSANIPFEEVVSDSDLPF